MFLVQNYGTKIQKKIKQITQSGRDIRRKLKINSVI